MHTGMTMKEVEITEIPVLSDGQTSLLNMHSFLNMLNVLHGELQLIGLFLNDDPDLLHSALALSEGMRAELDNPAACLSNARALPEMAASIKQTIADALARYSEESGHPDMVESCENIHSVLRLIELRAAELLARAAAPGDWREMSIEEVRKDFHEVFSAIEKNSRGRYRIIYNLALQEPSDYFVTFNIESDNLNTVVMPPTFKDVMRDLMANARKYTAPGGSISAGLYETRDMLKFTVQDNGRGIVEDELEKVVHYGVRGSNTTKVRTMGGGFGLTKALWVTKQFGGRFWIASAVGVGTRIRIEIPRSR